MTRPLLEVRDLATHFDTQEGLIEAVDGASFTIEKGETLGLVGESGCGKSVTAMSILQLNPVPPTIYARGQILFEGRDLLPLPDSELRKVRGNDIAMIFQEPMTSLNPVFTVGNQIVEALRLHKGLGRQAARRTAIELLGKVGIPAPDTRVDSYPHQMSGGMKQRVMIAMALACNPALLIADEPTTALDVTIQAQILDLLRAMQHEYGMSILLITHDLGVVAGMSDRVAVMYAGKVVELAGTTRLYQQPRHPYTYGLFESLPEMHAAGSERLREIPGTVPNPLHFPDGCRFHTRCHKAQERCAAEEPALEQGAAGHGYACHFPMTDDELGRAFSAAGRADAGGGSHLAGGRGAGDGSRPSAPGGRA